MKFPRNKKKLFVRMKNNPNIPPLTGAVFLRGFAPRRGWAPAARKKRFQNGACVLRRRQN